jgi:HK97 family phage prohead protease
MPVDVTTDKIRIRVKDPALFVQDSFRTITLSAEQGIESIIGKLQSDPQGPTVIQNYMFDKSKWTVAEAEKWVEKHKRQSGMECRSFDGNLGISIDNKEMKLRGTAIPYNRLSINPIEGLPNIKERILPGAFRSSVGSSSDIMMLWNHELKYVFGRTSKRTLSLREDQSGVHFENVPPDAQWVKDLIPSIKRGDISNMSFKFADNVEPSWTKEEGGYVRNVRDATLYEISVVTFPVYESTSVFARSAELMIVDGVVLDYVSPEQIVERIKTEDGRFKDAMNRYESLKKISWL